MNVLNQLGLNKLGGTVATNDEQRVLELFRNRAELKKAYSELQDEIHRLKERLRQQEGATTRVQEILAGLEARLENREQAYPAMVFYQLRRLWRIGHEVLAGYGADVEQQHVDLERRAFLVELNHMQFSRRQESEARLTAAQHAVVDARSALRDREQKLASLNRPWHRFRRKDEELKLPPLRAAMAAAEAALHAAREDHQRLLGEAEQDFPGLSLEARRAINLELIACAEVLCLRLAKSPLLALARIAATRRDATDEYGRREECEALMADIELAQAVLEQRARLPQEVKLRADRLLSSVVYAQPEDSVPTIESLAPRAVQLGNDPLVAALEKHTGDRRVIPANEPRPPNVLAEDSWDLFRVLVR